MTPQLEARDLARHMELTVLRADLAPADLEATCRDARARNLAALSVPSSMLARASVALEDSDVRLIAQIGFPHGLAHGDVKQFETELAVDEGAQEFEVMGSLMHLLAGDGAAFLRELRNVVETADGRPVRVALKWSVLTENQLQTGVAAVLDSGAHYLSTGPGFAEKLDEPEAIHRWRGLVGEKFWIKSAQSGGDENALACLRAGARRVGRVATL